MMLKFKMMSVLFMSGAYDFLNDAKNKAGEEVNPILGNIVIPILAGVLSISGILSLFWSIGQMKQGHRALLGIIYAIVSIISGAILVVVKIAVF